MSGLLGFALFLAVFCGIIACAFAWGVDEWRRRTVVAVGAVLLVVLAGSLTCFLVGWRQTTSNFNGVYTAAHTQNISVSVEQDRFQVYTTTPCRIDLDYRDGQLLIQGANRVASEEVVRTICASK